MLEAALFSWPVQQEEQATKEALADAGGSSIYGRREMDMTAHVQATAEGEDSREDIDHSGRGDGK